ncbi:hypothetical protein COW64_25765 [bacterium (Candidatus Blackallbacteria) CG18_big_fil_WC_8_21_14_2_50_49_26]|nr:MAG: hypothetical protein COW64_25765 [bacterium (Candidatus Blackallbacteria) CG18_big_fil_WC_8_21_14_2_50_49_26]
MVSPTPSTPPSATASASARVLTITSETNDPKLPKILVPGLELKVFAGSGKAGYKDGPALEAEFRSLGSLAQDEQDNLYITDYEDFRIRKIDNKGNVSTLAGTGKQVAQGKTGAFLETEFYRPGQMVFKASNFLLVQSESSGPRLFLLNLSTQQSQIFIKETERITNPPYHNFVLDSRQLPLAFLGEIYTMVVQNNEIFLATSSEIWKLSENQGLYHFQRYAGNQFVDPTGGSIDDPARNFKDGPPDDSKFNRPASMVFDKAGNMFVSDAGNHRIRKVEAGTRNVSTLTGYGIPESGSINRIFLGGYKDGPLKEALFDTPSKLILTDSEDILVRDSNNGGSMRLITKGQVHTLITSFNFTDFSKKGSLLFLADNKNLQIYTLDLSQLEKLKPKILKQEKPLS